MAQRLLEKPEDTLRLLQEDPQMQEVEFATLVLDGLGRELYYRPEEEAKAALREYGISEEIDAFMTLAFVSLPVIPKLRLNTYGIVDAERQQILPAVF